MIDHWSIVIQVCVLLRNENAFQNEYGIAARGLPGFAGNEASWSSSRGKEPLRGRRPEQTCLPVRFSREPKK